MSGGAVGARVGLLISLSLVEAACVGQTEFSNTRAETRRIQQKLTELEKKLADVESTMRIRELLSDRSTAYLTPSDEGYSVISNDLATLTVSLENVAAYANGSRVLLRFGNVTSAAIDGLSVKIEWGSLDESGRPQNERARNKEFTIPRLLRAGSWTSVPIILDGVPPAALGFVRVREPKQKGIQLLE